MKLTENTRITMILAIGGFACSMGLRVLDPVIPELAANYQVSIRGASLAASIFALAYGVGQLFMGPLADRLGRYKMLSLAMLLVTVFSSIALIPYSYTVLLTSRLGAGLFASAVVSSSLALLTQLYHAEERGTIIARFMMAIISGQLLGAVLMSQVAPHFYIMYLMLALLPFISLLLLYGFRENSTLNQTSQGKLLDHLILILKHTNLSLLALLGFAGGILVFGPIPFVSVKLAEHSTNSTSIAGFAVACFAIGGLLFSVVSRRVIKALKHSQFSIGISLLAICWFILSDTNASSIVLVTMFGVGFSFYTLHNMLQVNAGSCYPPASSSAISLFMFCFFCGQGLGPILFGAVMSHQGIQQAFHLFAIAAIIVATLSWFVRDKIINL